MENLFELEKRIAVLRWDLQYIQNEDVKTKKEIEMARLLEESRKIRSKIIA